MSYSDKKFKKQLKKHLPEILKELISTGRLNIVKTSSLSHLIEDKETNLIIRIKPSWNRPIKKGM
jgi:hypothetical protein